MDNELEQFIEKNREAFDNRMPDPAVLARIQQQLHMPVKKKGVLISMQKLRWAAAACFLVIAGVAVFRMMDQPATKPTGTADLVSAAPQKPIPATGREENNKTEAANIHSSLTQQAVSTPGTNAGIDVELNAQKTAFFAGLQNMELPSKRLIAAGQAYQLKNADKEIVDALVKAMNTDPNTNVRLAALEALSRFHRESYVKKQLVQSLNKQKDPVVQIELIQLLTKMKQSSILDELEKITNDGGTMDAVKDEAHRSILTLQAPKMQQIKKGVS